MILHRPLSNEESRKNFSTKNWLLHIFIHPIQYDNIKYKSIFIIISPDCRNWKEHWGCWHGDFGSFIRRNCQKTCGLC